MHKYDKDVGWVTQHCEICYQYTQCCQHHIRHRRYSDQVIWICNNCHSRIHSNPKWAYEKGYLIKHNGMSIEKKQKVKNCKHGVVYFDSAANKTICSLCGKKLR